MSLKVFHLVFLLIVIACTDLFAVWILRSQLELAHFWVVLIAILVPIGGIGLAAYSGWFVEKAEKAHLT